MFSGIAQARVLVACLAPSVDTTAGTVSRSTAPGFPEHRKEIDGLRALAVTAVVLYHAFALPAAGFLGVDVFFVISGYLITRLILSEYEQTLRISICGFYARRVRRILPAVLFLVWSVVAAASLLLSRDALIRAIDSAAASMVFSANIFFQSQTGYFAPNAEEMPLLHLWSLAVEEQFYLLWPLLILGLTVAMRRHLFPALLIASASSFGISLLIARSYPDAAFFEMPARFWELSVGGCIASLSTRGNVPRWLPGIALAGCVLSCCFSIQAVPGDGAILAIAATSTLLFCVHRSTNLGFAGVVLASKPMVALGLISYSLYLWHWPLLAYYRTLTIGQGSSTVRALLCLLALLLAIASYRYIEQPFRHGRFKTRPILIVGALATTMTAVGSVAWASHLRFERDFPPNDNPIAARAETDFPPDWVACHYQMWETKFPKCAFPEATMAIWGDSMAMSWSPAFAAAAKYTRDSCRPFIAYLPDHPLPRDTECLHWNQQVLESVKGLHSVILAARWQNHSREREEDFANDLRATFQALRDVPDVRVILPTPTMKDAVPHCLRLAKPCDMSRRQFESEVALARDSIRDAAKSFSNVRFLDATNYLCDSEICPGVRDGVALYRDAFHITAHAALRVEWTQMSAGDRPLRDEPLGASIANSIDVGPVEEKHHFVRLLPNRSGVDSPAYAEP